MSVVVTDFEQTMCKEKLDIQHEVVKTAFEKKNKVNRDQIQILPYPTNQYDGILVYKNKKYLIEFKFDYIAHYSGNMALEVIPFINYPTTKDDWVLACRARSPLPFD